MSNLKNKVYQKYCTGCGLCHSVIGTQFRKDEKGFLFPVVDEHDNSFFDSFCFVGECCANKQIDSLKYNIWGKNLSSYLGYSADETIRNKSSSGGVLTGLALYLLENNLVDGVIQTCVGKTPIETSTVISKTREDVLNCCGSRYSISMPLYDLKNIVKSGEKYAFVGKPCDVATLSLYLKENNDLVYSIPYLLSFFCAGCPSQKANEKLLSELGLSISDCQSLNYRGNGWPGKVHAVDTNGSSREMSYEKSWGAILGRDIRSICRFCLDGVGIFADVSCGDAWYTNSDGAPDFSEHDGRNIIFSRTKKGEELVRNAARKGYIRIEFANDYVNSLQEIQKYQYERKISMYSMLLAMKIFRKETPYYSMRSLKKISDVSSIKLKLKRFIGMCLRIVKKKI